MPCSRILLEEAISAGTRLDAMEVKLLQESTTRLCLRARPANRVIAATVLGLAVATVCLTRQWGTTNAGGVGLWGWFGVGCLWLGAVGLFQASKVRCTLDAATAQITIERGFFRRNQVRFPFD